MGYLLPIFGTILLSLFSGWVGYYLRDRGAYKEFLRSRFFDIVTDLEALRDLSTQYWSRNVEKINRNHDDIAQEAEMVAKNHAINLSIVALAPNIDSKVYAQLSQMLTDVRQASTKNPFEDESVDRLPDPQLIKEVHRRSFEMILLIRECASKPKGVWLKL
ncbi:hypothetical protein [Komagataeibacter diospyri]|uniref:hypothetical protein n=1 Tax=Komagataeibacter diospyri TaxID=1932662 RepID=UPI001143F80E|nr:hypothetical protein [Komagataeibacter diospyri]